MKKHRTKRGLQRNRARGPVSSTKAIQIRCTLQERKGWNEMAHKCCMTLSDFIRACMGHAGITGLQFTATSGKYYSALKTPSAPSSPALRRANR